MVNLLLTWDTCPSQSDLIIPEFWESSPAFVQGLVPFQQTWRTGHVKQQCLARKCADVGGRQLFESHKTTKENEEEEDLLSILQQVVNLFIFCRILQRLCIKMWPNVLFQVRYTEYGRTTISFNYFSQHCCMTSCVPFLRVLQPARATCLAVAS